MSEDDSPLDFKMDMDYSVTMFTVGILSLIACSYLIYKGQRQLESMRMICWQVIIYHLFFIATAGMVLFDLGFMKEEKSEDGTVMLNISDHKVSYTIYSLLNMGQGVTFQLIAWIFSYKYWVVSLTLRQLLSVNAKRFSQARQLCMFVGCALVFVTISILIGIIFWYEKMNTGTRF